VIALLAVLIVAGAATMLLVGLFPVADADGIVDVSRAAPVVLTEEALRFEDALLEDIAAYRGPRRIAALLATFLAVVVPLVMAGALRDGRAVRTLRLARRASGPAAQSAVATALVVLLTSLARSPIAVWAGISQDGRWGFRTRSAAGWLADHLVVVGARALAVGALVWLVATLAIRRPRDWPARVVVLVALIGPAVLLLHPLVVHPLLLPTGPMPEGEHRDAVVAVMEQSGTAVPVLIGQASLRTTRRNAVATGLGPTERIVLHDTLLDLEPREVAAIAAHELAHVERRDPLRAAVAPIPFVALVALILQRRSRSRPLDVRVLASAAAFVLALEAAAAPIGAAISRTIEHRTDVRSVMISQDPAAHVGLFRAFVIDGLADPDPPRWSVMLWATHPTPAQRIVAVSDAADRAMR
jgi:STE24 endopeptidase